MQREREKGDDRRTQNLLWKRRREELPLPLFPTEQPQAEPAAGELWCEGRGETEGAVGEQGPGDEPNSSPQCWEGS